ncbi:MAG: hypothetical protein KBA40_02440 [Candidatus Peribacteraceae bacterium]|nr:hypothetical protein [Candidatus Peribacteraceae bacterium]MBP9850740.1 hypothetical protein [Candidatus Peribacteraceae bacterium]
MSAADKVRTIDLEGSPPCKLHVPNGADSRWIAEAVEKRSEVVRKLVDEMCAGRNVIEVETHGPGVALPVEYHVGSRGNVSGLTGITFHFPQEEALRCTEPYSTLGGNPTLGKYDPSSASTILMQALRKAGTLLQSKG